MNDKRLDKAIAGVVLERRWRGNEYCPGDVICGLDVRLDDEGPNSWTRFDEVIIEPKHLKMADQMATEDAEGQF